ncbi:magnesium transporter MRS2-3-like [Syzygium oleosum]|uniref:magnesium transporter MRS2-3-like n=1 Tax=Syzygium oleosum TaxID=219896 RepID=UPI0024B9F72B|nr:magnesium transporter MRS2-3-like [Syzygium oleosum]
MPRDDPAVHPAPIDTGNTKDHRHRKKAVRLKTWLVIDSTGRVQQIDVGKQSIMRRTGLSARDLRILDPFLSYPLSITGRERAIVIKLEHIKGIITAHNVLLLNYRDPAVVPFVEELKRRFLHYHEAKAAKIRGNGGDERTAAELAKIFQGSQESVEHSQLLKEQQDRSQTLPFEFVALEACLEAACSCLDDETKALEQEAYPALDKLTSEISSFYLERVRQIKGRLVALTQRVQKVRDELEHLLEDDGDMAGMYLTSKLLQEEDDNSSSSAAVEEEDEAHELNNDDRHDSGDPNISPDDGLTPPRGSLNNEIETAKSSDSRSAAPARHVHVAELEMLLEAYFVQVDGTLNKLSTLREYIQDTEDYVNIMLDDKQNNLLQMGVVISTVTLFITMFIVVTGIFSMNIRIAFFHPPNPTINNFLWTAGRCTVRTIVLYAMAIAWYKHKRFI